MSLLSNLTTSAKVSLAMRTVGLNKTETSAIDKLICKVGSNPIAILATGNEFTSLKSVIAAGIDKSSDFITSPHLHTAAGWLANPDVRRSLGDIVMDFIEKSDDRVPLTRALEKIAALPFPGLGDTEHETHKDFVSEGIFGLVSAKINELNEAGNPDSDDDVLVLTECPSCSTMFYS